MITTPPRTAPSTTAWLAGWALVGALLGTGLLAVLTVGALAVVAGIALAVLLARREASRAGWPGLLVGLAVPALLVAVLNRQGPGTVCTSTATSQDCVQQWSPWPWVAVAVVLVALAVVALRRTRRRVTAG